MINLINLSQILNLFVSRSRTDDGVSSGLSSLQPSEATYTQSLRHPSTSAAAQPPTIPRPALDAPRWSKSDLDSVRCRKGAERMFNK